MTERMRFALNHIAAPRLRPDAFFALAARLGMAAVEIRNDLAGNAVADGTGPEAIRAAAAGAGVEILSINALQRFDDWSEARAAEAAMLARYARACGARALVLVPTNDGAAQAAGERQGRLRTALGGLKPILEESGLTGLVEPLGFETCSLRRKSEAVAAIDAVAGRERFRLVHDTFHHHLAGEAEMFAEMTGLVHVSGVDDPGIATAAMRDAHRVLVGPEDRLGNLSQIRALVAGGYRGVFSFEPFAAEVQALDDPEAALAGSMRYLREGVAATI